MHCKTWYTKRKFKCTVMPKWCQSYHFESNYWCWNSNWNSDSTYSCYNMMKKYCLRINARSNVKYILSMVIIVLVFSDLTNTPTKTFLKIIFVCIANLWWKNACLYLTDMQVFLLLLLLCFSYFDGCATLVSIVTGCRRHNGRPLSEWITPAPQSVSVTVAS